MCHNTSQKNILQKDNIIPNYECCALKKTLCINNQTVIRTYKRKFIFYV